MPIFCQNAGMLTIEAFFLPLTQFIYKPERLTLCGELILFQIAYLSVEIFKADSANIDYAQPLQSLPSFMRTREILAIDAQIRLVLLSQVNLDKENYLTWFYTVG